jgi:hypothetical protein
MIFAEYGAVGAFLVCMPYVLLVLFSLYRLFVALFPKRTKPVDSSSSSENERTPFQEVVPPAAFASAIAAAGIWSLSFQVSVFRHPAVLVLWTISLVVLHASLPKPLSPSGGEESSGRRQRKGWFSLLFRKKTAKSPNTPS